MKSGTLRTQAQALKFLSADGGVRKSVFDAQCQGLQLDRLGIGRGRWRLRYTNHDRGDRQCLTLGEAPMMTLSQARDLANQKKLQSAMGEDPVEQRKLSAQVLTFAEFAEQRYLPYVRTYKRSANSDECYLRCQILPVLGKKYLDEITKKDIIDLHHGLKAKGYKPGTCNRSLVLVRYAFNLAIRWEIPGVTKNPTKDVPLFEDLAGKRDRFLTQEETHQLFEAVKASENPMLQFIVPMLILTGARKREVLDAKWEDIDMERRQWRIPVTKLGRPRYVPISSGVINLLANVPHDEKVPYVFPNPDTGKPYREVFKSWDTARKRAGLAEVRMHDLRHSFASFLVNAGRTLYECQRILGHTQIKTTQRYAHLSQDTLIDAADAVGNFVGKALPEPVTITPGQLGFRHV